MDMDDLNASGRDLLHMEDILRRHIPEEHPAWKVIGAALTIERCNLQIESAMRILDPKEELPVPPEDEWMAVFEEYHQ